MTRFPQLPLVMLILMSTTPSLAADQTLAPPAHGPVMAAPPPPLLPPCREAFWATSLYCIPRAEVYAPHDPYLHSYLRSLRPVQRKPYVQVFTW
jgi:hypothetical protein